MMAKCETRTEMTKTVISTGLDQPHAIAVWPQKGYGFILCDYFAKKTL